MLGHPQFGQQQVRRASLVGPWRLALTGAVGAVGVLFAGGPYFYSLEDLNVVMASLYYILLLPTGAALCVLVWAQPIEHCRSSGLTKKRFSS